MSTSMQMITVWVKYKASVILFSAHLCMLLIMQMREESYGGKWR